MKTTALLLFLITTLISILATPVDAADRKITISWTLNTNSDTTIYRVYQSNKRGVYDLSNVVATVDKSQTEVYLTIPNDRKTYFFIVTALDQNGNESLRSNEVSTRLLVFDWLFGLFSSNKNDIKLVLGTE